MTDDRPTPPRTPDRPSILIAPDSFKGTFSAAEVATAIARGVESAGVDAVSCPVADGGEGTIDALLAALGGERRSVTVNDPLGRPVSAEFALLDDGETAVVESAAASGLHHVDGSPGPAAALRATTTGTGELIVAARAAGARTILVAVGGSATTDGGRGALDAISEAGGLDGVRLRIICDVDTSFEHAATVFARQKGADDDAVERLTHRLDARAAALPRDPRGVPMTGCGGGLSGGLWATYDADLLPGADFVLDAIGFDALAAEATAVVTGEGRLDDQTLAGKLIGRVAHRCAAMGTPLHAVVGQATLTPNQIDRLGLASVTAASSPEALVAAGRALGEQVAG